MHTRQFASVFTLLSLIVTVSCAVTLQLHAQAADLGKPGDALVGEWWTEGREGLIKFQRYRDGTYRGTTICCLSKHPDDDHPLTDLHNPNPALRARSAVGFVIIWKLVFEDGEYSGGYVYNPRDGKTYRMKIASIDKDTIKIRGYLGISLLGQTQIWKRATPAEIQAAPHQP